MFLFFLSRLYVLISKSTSFKIKQTHISPENPSRATCFATTPVK